MAYGRAVKEIKCVGTSTCYTVHQTKAEAKYIVFVSFLANRSDYYCFKRKNSSSFILDIPTRSSWLITVDLQGTILSKNFFFQRIQDFYFIWIFQNIYFKTLKRERHIRKKRIKKTKQKTSQWTTNCENVLLL